MDWQDFLAAVCLMLVFEGMMPFISPDRWRKMVEALGEFSDRQIRSIGLISMISGVVMLYLVKS